VPEASDRPAATETRDPAAAESRDRAAAGSRNLRGRLETVEADVLRVVDEENRKTYNVRFGDIRQARLEYEWPERRR
jgi:ribosome maturation factor RimP